MENSSEFSRRGFLKTAAAASASTAALSLEANAAERPAMPSPSHSFASNWHAMPDRYFTGADTWANPWEDWRIEGGRLVCVKGGGPNRRTVHCLTHEFRSLGQPAQTAVTITPPNASRNAGGDAGFVLGIRVNDPIDDYRSRLLFGSGMLVLLHLDGSLRIGQEQETFPALADALATGKSVRLVCDVASDVENAARPRVSIHLQAVDAEDPNRLFGSIRAAAAPERTAGNIALTTTFNDPRAEDGAFAFSDWRIEGGDVLYSPERAFGPILWTLYTLSRNVLKLTAQMAMLGPNDNDTCEFQIRKDDAWRTVAATSIEPLSRTATFRVSDWDDTQAWPYRVLYEEKLADGRTVRHTYDGTIQRDPRDKPEIVVAGYCCFMDQLFPNVDIVRQTASVDPDILFFVGDQLYEGVGGWGIVQEGDLDRMFANYLRKLALLGWSFRDITKDRPTIWMPDDHDVYHGNVWGASGRNISLEEWRSKTDYQGAAAVGAWGGYVQPAEWVKAVERTQCAHLPDPYDPTSIDQGIGVYYTSMDYGRIGFAILEDRKFKSGPLAVFQHESHRPDWIVDRQTALEADVPEAVLLGDRQMAFLKDWTTQWNGVDMKVAVSQTIFANAATHHGSSDHFLVADMDSNGWPQSGRNAALDVLRRGYAFMLGGDQHLPTVIQHGIAAPRDAGFSFCVPAGMVGYQRWWLPEEVDDMVLATQRRDELPNTGQYRDGFGNLIDVWAVANPPKQRTAKTRLEVAQQKSSGFGVVRLNRAAGTVTMEAIVVGADQQYPGWPVTVAYDAMVGEANIALPTVICERYNPMALGRGVPIWPVVQVRDADGNIVSSVRMHRPEHTPMVFDPDGVYSVRLVLPEDEDRVYHVFENVKPGAGQLRVGFE